MKVFLTGASGHLGQVLVRHLLAEDHQVVALNRSPAAAKRLRSQGAEVVAGDLLHPTRLTNHLRDCQAVIHLAGSSLDEADVEHCRRIDTEATTRLLESIARERIERVVYASSVAVMGDQDGQWVTEALPPAPGTPHGQTKLETERILLEAQRLWSLPAVVLRFAHIYGPGGHFGRLTQELRERQLTLTPKVLEAQWGLVSVEDAARACLHALTHGRPGQTVFVADDHPQALGDVLATLSRTLGLPPVRVAKRMLERWRLDKARLSELGESLRPRNAKLKSEIRFRLNHRSLADGLEAVMKPGVEAGVA